MELRVTSMLYGFIRGNVVRFYAIYIHFHFLATYLNEIQLKFKGTILSIIDTHTELLKTLKTHILCLKTDKNLN